MPKTKNIARAQWDHATQPTTNNSENNLANTTFASALSPPTRSRPHASRTTSTTSMATRHRRSKENSENGGGEKENTGRLSRSTRTHVTPGVLSTAFVSSNLSAGFTSNSHSILGSSKKALAPTKPPKPTLTKRRVKKQPLQDVTAQFVASGMGEGANRAGTAYEQLGEEDILALREQAANDVTLEAPARVATAARGHRNGGAEPTSPLPPSSPPSDYRLPSSLTFNLAQSVPLAAPGRAAAARAHAHEREPASPAHSIPVPEYDPWDSFDSAPPVGSPTRPVPVAEAHDADDGVDREDPFGFAALERKLKANRELLAPTAPGNDADALVPAGDNEDEDEDIDSLLVADTSSPRPEGVRLRRRNMLKRALEEELDEEDQDAAAHSSFAAGSSPILFSSARPRTRTRGAVLSSPVRAAIAAAGPASTPAAAEASPVHAHFATPPTPHKETHKRRRISGVPDADADGDIAHDVFGPCLPTSSSSPGKVEAESPSPSKSGRKVRAPAPAAMGRDGANTLADAGDALDVFNAAVDARDATATVDEGNEGDHEVVRRTLRPRASRTSLGGKAAEVADAQTEATTKTKSRSASRGRGRGASRARGRGRGASHSRSRGRRAQPQVEKDAADEEEGVDQDEKFEQARQARIAYFRGLDDYEVETEDVYLI